MATLRSTESFSAYPDGVLRVVSAGDLVDSTDAIVNGRAAFFEPVEAYMSSRRSDVEEATAAPGEKRTRTATAKKASSSRKTGDQD